MGESRYTSEAYKWWVRQRPCCLTGQTHRVDGAHVRRPGTGAAIQPPDFHLLPLLRDLHQAEHHFGPTFWEGCFGQDSAALIPIAESLHQIWLNGDPTRDQLGDRFIFDTLQSAADKVFIAGILMGVTTLQSYADENRYAKV